MDGSGRSSRGILWTGACVSGVLKEDCEITNPFIWSLQPESSKWDSPTVLCSQKKGQTLTNKRLNLTNRCRSSPSQRWHQRRQNTSINSSLPVTSASRGIISHCHIHYRHAGRCERECISLWELTDSVFTGFIHRRHFMDEVWGQKTFGGGFRCAALRWSVKDRFPPRHCTSSSILPTDLYKNSFLSSKSHNKSENITTTTE